MAFYAGIECEVVNGYGRTAQSALYDEGMLPNHSWNAVKLSGNWYFCDATWASGFIDPNNGQFIKDFTEAYFFTSPALFVRNHYPLDSQWQLTSETITLQQFYDEPLIYRDALENYILPYSPNTFKLHRVKGQNLVIVFAAPSYPHHLELELVLGGRIKNYQPKITVLGNGLYQIDHTLTMIGHWTAHVKQNDAYLFSYDVSVVKR